MLAKVLSSAVLGIEAYPVEVEVDISNGLPAFTIVGLPDLACRESADRVRAALRNSGLRFPVKRITVNLAPADLKKEGAVYDLAIAIGILTADGQLEESKSAGVVYCGELSLDGRLRGVPGILPRAAAMTAGCGPKDLVLPDENAEEALCVAGIRVFAFRDLRSVIRHLKGESVQESRAGGVTDQHPDLPPSPFDFSDIKGQALVKRGLEVAAAGGHNTLLIGPPGSGKTMLARRVPTILSALTSEEAVQTTKIHSVAGLLTGKRALVGIRPFRDPHHTISHVAMVGGGTHPKPGEVSLAHHGVLFLDELPEFRRNVLEVLRQPIEEGRVCISRAVSTVTWPARFMLIAAMNPCPCGHYTDPKKECHCTHLQIKNYLSRVSGPLLDRIDIQLEVPRLKVDEITGQRPSEKSEAVRERVEKAAGTQRRRFAKLGIRHNSEMSPAQVEQYCRPDAEGTRLLEMAIQELGFSARAYHKCLKVARTIADLEGASGLEARHLQEAIQYRALDRSLWVR